MNIAVPLYGFGASGGTGGVLTVTVSPGELVTVSNGDKSQAKAANASGVAVFKGLKAGAWTVAVTRNGKPTAKTVIVVTDYSVSIPISTIPEFTYTGDFEIVNDSDEPITVSNDNWKIRFLTSGTLTFTNLNGAGGGIDVFLVGGGSGSTYSGTSRGGGGAGGYTRTVSNIPVTQGVPIDVIIGAGSAAGGRWSKKGDGPGDGGYSAFGEYQAAGGHGQTNLTTYTIGLSGGTGGQIYAKGNSTPATDGDDGYAPASASASDIGKGQRSTPGINGETGTTREFGEPSGKLYSNGGCYSNTLSPRTNSGDGGISSENQNAYGTDGASGIVIIRNARGAA